MGHAINCYDASAPLHTGSIQLASLRVEFPVALATELKKEFDGLHQFVDRAFMY